MLGTTGGGEKKKYGKIWQQFQQTKPEAEVEA